MICLPPQKSRGVVYGGLCARRMIRPLHWLGKPERQESVHISSCAAKQLLYFEVLRIVQL